MADHPLDGVPRDFKFSAADREQLLAAVDDSDSRPFRASPDDNRSPVHCYDTGVVIQNCPNLASSIDPAVVVSRSVIVCGSVTDVGRRVDVGQVEGGRDVDRCCEEGVAKPRRQQYTHRCICTEKEASRSEKQVYTRFEIDTLQRHFLIRILG